MIYTNDEADKSIRQRNFYLTVFVLPIGLIIGICVFVYLATKSNYLPKGDALFGYISSPSLGIYLFAYNMKKWLRMPDGTFHNIKDIKPTNKFYINEPAEYEFEYFYSKNEKITSTLLGIALIGFFIWSLFVGMNSILIPIAIIIMGMFFSYFGIKGLLDKSAKLKLAKTGLWTAKLGFVEWKDIIKAQVIEDASGKSPQTILEIYLKGTIFAEANRPDERLNLTDIEGKQFAETEIYILQSKHNEHTK